MQRDAAETIALKALKWLAASDELLPVFIGSTGVAASDLSAAANEADFLGAVLDFILMDDAWVITFCQDAGLDYSKPAQARAALPGGQQYNWT